MVAVSPLFAIATLPSSLASTNERQNIALQGRSVSVSLPYINPSLCTRSARASKSSSGSLALNSFIGLFELFPRILSRFVGAISLYRRICQKPCFTPSLGLPVDRCIVLSVVPSINSRLWLCLDAIALKPSSSSLLM